MNDSVLIIGGGTGGHISPGIALYEEMKQRGMNVTFLTGRRDARFSSLKDVSKDDLFYYGAPSFTKNIFKLPFFAMAFFRAMKSAKRLFKSRKVTAVIGMGGYVSAPALMAARLAKIDFYLCEQNTVPGKVTFLFEKHAKRLFGTFESSELYLKFREKYTVTGNPIRKKVFTDISKTEARKVFNLSHAKKVILAIGGSQGALRLNELVVGLKTKFPDEFSEIGVIWSTGDLSFEKYNRIVTENFKSGAVYLSPFIENVGAAYMACDLAISRSGSGVMVELAAMSIPSVLIPYPHAAADHQNKNADEFVAKGASIKISDSDATAEISGETILELLSNERQLRRMSEKAGAAAKIDAAEKIVNFISGGK